MAVNFSGIVSGFDTKALIEATVNAQRQPVNRLESRKSDYESQISTLGKVTSALNELKTLMEEMEETANVLAFDATSSDEDLLTAEVTGSASQGSYELVVTDLARAEKDRSASFVSKYEPVKAGTITITAAGEDAVEIEIADGDTLEEVVEKINASGAKVDASLINDGTNNYLQIVATDTGHTIGGSADDALTISESYTGSTGSELGMTQVVQAKNAKFTVDGLPVEQRTNTVTSVLTDVTLNLKDEGTVTLDIASNRDGTKEKIQAFVDKFNSVLDLIDDSTTTSDGGRAVDSDPTLLQVRADMRSLVAESVAGLSTSYNALARIGIRTSATTGKLEIKTTDFDSALDKDIRSVGRIFTQADSGLAARLLAKIEGYTDSTDGSLTNRTKSLNSRITETDTQIGRMEERIDRLTTTLQRQFTAMEQTLSNLQNQGSLLTSLLYQ